MCHVMWNMVDPFSSYQIEWLNTCWKSQLILHWLLLSHKDWEFLQIEMIVQCNWIEFQVYFQSLHCLWNFFHFLKSDKQMDSYCWSICLCSHWLSVDSMNMIENLQWMVFLTIKWYSLWNVCVLVRWWMCWVKWNKHTIICDWINDETCCCIHITWWCNHNHCVIHLYGCHNWNNIGESTMNKCVWNVIAIQYIGWCVSKVLCHWNVHG